MCTGHINLFGISLPIQNHNSEKMKFTSDFSECGTRFGTFPQKTIEVHL